MRLITLLNPRRAMPLVLAFAMLLASAATALAQPTTAPSTTSTPSTAPAPTTALHAEGDTAVYAEPDPLVPAERGIFLGSYDPASGYKLRVELSQNGASVYQVWLAEYEANARKKDHYLIQAPVVVHEKDRGDFAVRSMAARSVTVGDHRVDVSENRITWFLDDHSDHAATFRTRIVDADGKAVLTVFRTYTLDKGSYEIACEQRFRNESDTRLEVSFSQSGLMDLPADPGFRDYREFFAGYIDPPHSATIVYADKTMTPRATVISAWETEAKKAAEDKTYARKNWPVGSLKDTDQLIWIAECNRYFAAGVHAPLVQKTGENAPSPVPLTDAFPDISNLVYGTKDPSADIDGRAVLVVLGSRKLSLAPAAEQSLSVMLFSGPRDKTLFAQAPYNALGFSNLVYFSGSCAFCTFQPLANFMLAFLTMIHYVFRDWGIAIIVLVLIIRLALHPITRRSQIAMARFSKQMAKMKPEMDRIKKKYKDDTRRAQEEMMKMQREQGVSYGAMLGCLPMFLQMPIWVALYSMLSSAIQLHHQAAFFGIFQRIIPSWSFLADLSEPDHFIRFSPTPHHLSFPILNMVDYSSLNIIPLLMGVVFYFQQKLTQPPAADEQTRQQQKMMAIMTTLLFPVMMYSVPSGLTLYILASTFAGIVDSWVVRRHIKGEEERGTFDNKPKSPKPGGLWDRLQKMVEQQQQLKGRR